jgi:hypothetical protein
MHTHGTYCYSSTCMPDAYTIEEVEERRNKLKIIALSLKKPE